MLVSYVKEIFGLEMKDISDISDTLFLSWFNRLEDYLYYRYANQDPFRSIKETSTQTVNSTTNYFSLPDDFLNITVKDCGLYYVDSNGNPTKKILPGSYEDTNVVRYRIEGSNVEFSGLSGDDTSVKMRYFPSRDRSVISSPGTGETDDAILDEKFLDLYIEGLKKHYFRVDEDPNREAMADQRFNTLISSFERDFARDTKIISLTDISTNQPTIVRTNS